jgi:glucans biosynthesis protein
VSTFADEAPRGFGLAQRDHDVNNYHDGVNYHRRPTLWVEPKGNWGRGSIQLIEIPTDDEIHDNIVAAWVPERPAQKGAVFSHSYRILWQAQDPAQAAARVVATRLGNGGQAGTTRPKGMRKFVAEFFGAPLSTLPSGVKPEAVVSVSRGSVSGTYTEAVPNDIAGHWRAVFDLEAAGSEPVELRCFLRLNGQTLSETWAFQYHPF